MTDAEQTVAAILRRCGTEHPVMPPTTLYEEGWMLRLVLDWFAHHSPQNHSMSFLSGSHWYSEALLHSQFRSRKRGDNLAESWTHADGVIGDFNIGGTGSGDLVLKGDASQLIVVEAKMFSGLSAGTKNAPTYNQAARNIACIAEALAKTNRKATDFQSLGFFVCAPEEQIRLGIFKSQLERDNIRQTVRDRAQVYDGAKDTWLSSWFEETLAIIKIDCLSWEEIIEHISQQDAESGQHLADFYSKCLHFNRRKKLLPTAETEMTPVKEKS